MRICLLTLPVLVEPYCANPKVVPVTFRFPCSVSFHLILQYPTKRAEGLKPQTLNSRDNGKWKLTYYDRVSIGVI